MLRVVSQEVSETIEEETQKVPYVIARGDGSIGGGGLPMPQNYPSSKNQDNDKKEELRRPKVSAEMPQG